VGRGIDVARSKCSMIRSTTSSMRCGHPVDLVAHLFDPEPGETTLRGEAA
jgi:hypothetical protein